MIIISVDQWSCLGDNGQIYFDQSLLAYFLCPTTTQGLDLKKTWLVTDPQYIKFKIDPCVEFVGTCRSYTEQNDRMQTAMNTYGYLQAYVYFLDQSLAPSKQQPIQYFLNVDLIFSFTDTTGVIGKIYLGSYKIDTDVGLMPFQDISTVNGTYVSNSRMSTFSRIPNSTDTYCYVQFYMSPNQINLQRKVGKIDEMLSYAGGLFSLIISFFAFFLMSFNQYRYELMIAQNLFNYDEHGNKIKQSQMGIWIYIKYSIFDWVNTLCCKQICWEDCKKVNNTRDEVTSHIDVTRLFKKIQKLEAASAMAISQELKDCLSIVKPETIEELKKQRLILQYYQKVLDGDSSLTIENIRVVKAAMKYGVKLSSSEMDKAKVIDSSLIQFHEGLPTGFNQDSKLEFKKNFDDEYDQAINQFPEIVEAAQKLQLQEDYIEIEKHLAQSFNKLSQQTRESIGLKIPIKILYRLKKVSEEKGGKKQNRSNMQSKLVQLNID